MTRALPDKPGFRACPGCKKDIPESRVARLKTGQWDSWCYGCKNDYRRGKNLSPRTWWWRPFELDAIRKFYPMIGTGLVDHLGWTHRTKQSVIKKATRMKVAKNETKTTRATRALKVA